MRTEDKKVEIGGMRRDWDDGTGLWERSVGRWWDRANPKCRVRYDINS